VNFVKEKTSPEFVMSYPSTILVNMEVHKTYKQRLLLSPEQTKLCGTIAGIVRLVYNLSLEQRLMAYSLTRKSLNYYDQSKELPDLKEAFPFIKLASAQSIQQGLKDLQKSFDRFFKKISGFPSYRKRGINDSFRNPDPSGFKISMISKRKGSINLPKLGTIYFRCTQKILGKPLFATVSRQAGNWYISITCSINTEDLIDPKKPLIPINQRTPIGIDRGCHNTIATSEPIDNRYLHSLPTNKLKLTETRIKFLQRQLSNKIKYSNNYKKLRFKITKKHKKLRNLRHDWHHKMTTKIAKNHSYIFLEALKVKNMTKSASGTLDNPGTNVAQKRGLNKSILRQAWGIFESMLTYKSGWYGSTMGKKPHPAFTSQKCHQCKHVHSLNRDGEDFLCRRCHHHAHADVNLIACETRDSSLPSLQEPTTITQRVLVGIPGL